MTEEIKINEEQEKNECKCFCHSKGFRKFLITALGTFVGVYAALSLFAALHKPPMMRPCPMGYGFGNRPPVMAPMMHHRHHFDKHQKFDRGNFNLQDKDFQRQAPFQKDIEKR